MRRVRVKLSLENVFQRSALSSLCRRSSDSRPPYSDSMKAVRERAGPEAASSLSGYMMAADAFGKDNGGEPLRWRGCLPGMASACSDRNGGGRAIQGRTTGRTSDGEGKTRQIPTRTPPLRSKPNPSASAPRASLTSSPSATGWPSRQQCQPHSHHRFPKDTLHVDTYPHR